MFPSQAGEIGKARKRRRRETNDTNGRERQKRRKLSDVIRGGEKSWIDGDKEGWVWRECALLVAAAVLCREPIHHDQINFGEGRRSGEKGKIDRAHWRQHAVCHPLPLLSFFPPLITLS